MVLVNIKDIKNERLFINSICGEDGETELTILQKSTAYEAKLSSNSSCVVKWAANLQLSTADYLQQLHAAIECINSNGGQTEHVFDVSKGHLSWKQYFADKKVHGKRGNIPLEEVPHSSAAWTVLEAAAQQQQAALQSTRQLQQENSSLRQECQRAVELAQRAVKVKDEFQQQSYAKFCCLLNAKKDRIRDLENKLTQPQGNHCSNTNSTPDQPIPSTSRDATNPTDVKSSSKSCSSGVKTKVSKKQQSATTGAAEGGTSAQHSDDDFDDDTDVDDLEGCDTDEEKEEAVSLRTSRAALSRMSRPVQNTDSAAATSASIAHGKRKNLNDDDIEDSSGRNAKKPGLLLDSQDDSFNSSSEVTNRNSLLNNIKPRVDNSKVSSRKFEQTNREYRCLKSNVHVEQNLSSKRDNETANLVASILRKNVRERSLKGYEMPKRSDDFDFIDRYSDAAFLGGNKSINNGNTSASVASNVGTRLPSLSSGTKDEQALNVEQEVEENPDEDNDEQSMPNIAILDSPLCPPPANANDKVKVIHTELGKEARDATVESEASPALVDITDRDPHDSNDNNEATQLYSDVENDCSMTSDAGKNMCNNSGDKQTSLSNKSAIDFLASSGCSSKVIELVTDSEARIDDKGGEHPVQEDEFNNFRKGSVIEEFFM